MGANQVKESLYCAIEQSDEEKVASILKELIKLNIQFSLSIQEHPDLLNCSITDDCKSTALTRSVWRNDKKLVKLLLELGCEVEYTGDRGITSLMWAAKRGHIEMAKFLIEKGAKIDTRSTDADQFTPLEQAITVGQYEMCLFLLSLDATQADNLKSGDVYREGAKGKYLSYCNYESFLEHLKARVPFDSCPSFFKRPPEPELVDPVIDPRETWGQFFKRTLEFEEPPLVLIKCLDKIIFNYILTQVERSDLPENLQPQNRLMGKIRAYLNGQTPYPANYDKPQKAEKIIEQNIEIIIDQNQNDNQTQQNVNRKTKEIRETQEINL